MSCLNTGISDCGIRGKKEYFIPFYFSFGLFSLKLRLKLIPVPSISNDVSGSAISKFDKSGTISVERSGNENSFESLVFVKGPDAQAKAKVVKRNLNILVV